jgi:hypothetical protein
VLGLYKETYYDLNIRHFHEKLRDEHAIQLSYTWVQKALQGAGLVAKRHKRGRSQTVILPCEVPAASHLPLREVTKEALPTALGLCGYFASTTTHS